MTASSFAPKGVECGLQPDANTPVTDCGELWSSQPGGAKVSTLRSPGIHLVHTGVPEGWNGSEVDSFFAAIAETLGTPAPGMMAVPAALPLSLQGWMEAIRYAQEELWPGAADLGTTLIAHAGDDVWVLSRGAHRVTLECTAGEATPDRPAGISGDVRAWRLAHTHGWRIEVALRDSPGALWSARWRPVPQPVEPEAVSATPEASADVAPEPSAPTAPPRRLPIPPFVRGLAVRAIAWVTALRRPEHRRLAIGLSAALVLLVAFAVAPKRPLRAAATWTGDVVSGRYRAHVESQPPGAAIAVDGKSTGQHTPATVVLHAGAHRLTLSLGEFGDTDVEVEGGRGARRAATGALLGSLSIACADSTIVLYAQLDGKTIGRVPARVDSVAAGRRRLSFQGRDARPWTEEVKVVTGKRTTVIARPERVPEFGHVMARSFRVGPTGLSDAPGAQVFLDGYPVGATPVSLQVPRGLHTVRLVAGSEKSPVQLLRVDGGGELYATAEFGRSPEPEVAAELSGPASLAKPPQVRASLGTTAPLRIGEIRLFVRHMGRDFRRITMTLKEGTLGTYGEAALPLTGLQVGDDLTYFVAVESDEGEEFVSEMRRVRIVR